MENNNATQEGRSKLLIIGLLEGTIKKSNKKHYLRSEVDVYIKKIITKSNSHQIKPEQNNLTYTSLEKTWYMSSMQKCLKWLKRSRKKEQIGAKFKNTFIVTNPRQQ